MLFRIWLMTALVVACIVAGWAFGIQLVPADPLGADPSLGFDSSGLMDDRGR